MHSKYTIHSVQRMYKFNDVRFKISLVRYCKLQNSKINQSNSDDHPPQTLHVFFSTPLLNPKRLNHRHICGPWPSIVPEIRTQFWSHVLAELLSQAPPKGHGWNWASTRFLFVQNVNMSWILLSTRNGANSIQGWSNQFQDIFQGNYARYEAVGIRRSRIHTSTVGTALSQLLAVGWSI